MKIPVADQNASSQNLLEITIFLLISIIAFNFMNVNLFLMCSEPLKIFLGFPPAAIYINVALAIYLFSAFTIRMVSIFADIKPVVKWSHLGYRTTFFFFFALSGSLAFNFYAVFFIGLGLYMLDQFHIYFYNYKHVEPKVYLKEINHE